MTFQRQTAHRIIDLARALRPDVKIVVGGYDPSLAPDAYEEMGVDYIVRGEGEVTFRELLRALVHVFNLLRWCFNRSHSCSITSFWVVCKPWNGNPSQGFNTDSR
jgi:hypothetical protein